jgi:hypothetical protein
MFNRSDRPLENPPFFLFFPPLNRRGNSRPFAIVRMSATAFGHDDDRAIR